MEDNTNLSDIQSLTILEAKSIIGLKRRISFEVVTPCNGYNVGDIVTFMSMNHKPYLLNLSGYANMVVDKFNVSLMKSLTLKPIKVIGQEIEELNYSIVKPEIYIKSFESQINLDEYITRSYLESTAKKLKDSKYTKDHVMGFLNLLLNKSLK